eukprot:TRINITY_DN3874_c0_g1_i1.p1 TRINITY_DN3874_c0_g1~~TRINITY_DN3874_c0_g1_i1.p1  ORF type:complete len:116 (+),score=12.04 TRINITY_DN3874_c0_g1_i1:162-509(+)
MPRQSFKTDNLAYAGQGFVDDSEDEDTFQVEQCMFKGPCPVRATPGVEEAQQKSFMNWDYNGVEWKPRGRGRPKLSKVSQPTVTVGVGETLLQKVLRYYPALAPKKPCLSEPSFS